MRCGDEDELVAYAEGILDRARARLVAEHVDACAACRVVLAGLVRGPRSTHAGVRPPAAPATALPVGLVAQYLRHDAPNRERAISRFWGTVMLADVVWLSVIGREPSMNGVFQNAAAIVACFFVYEVGVLLALRRGWFHQALPLASTFVEIALFVVMNAHVTLAMPHDVLVGRPVPAPAVGVLLVMFSSIRARPALCLVAGTLAAAGYALPALVAPARAAPPLVVSAVLLVAGVAAATMARYLVTRAEAALHEIREQDLFGKYILHEPIGTGGMGQVFRATYAPEGGFVRTVAVKRVRFEAATGAGLQQRLREEARLSAKLTHPNVVQVLDCGTFQGAFVLVMEYVDGASLAKIIRAGRLPIGVVAFVGAELAAALAYIHARRGSDGASLGLVHCDLNPPNVLVSSTGEVKLGDFGVARLATEADTGMFSGKVRYAAPEQLRGDTLDARADLFALGLTLHHALIGEPPFRSGETALTCDVRRVATLRDDVPADLDALITELTAGDRERRPRDAASVRARLRAVLAAPESGASYEDDLGALARAAR